MALKTNEREYRDFTLSVLEVEQDDKEEKRKMVSQPLISPMCFIRMARMRSEKWLTLMHLMRLTCLM